MAKIGQPFTGAEELHQIGRRQERSNAAQTVVGNFQQLWHGSFWSTRTHTHRIDIYLYLYLSQPRNELHIHQLCAWKKVQFSIIIIIIRNSEIDGEGHVGSDKCELKYCAVRVVVWPQKDLSISLLQKRRVTATERERDRKRLPPKFGEKIGQ